MKIVRRIIVFLFVLVCAFFAFANLNRASADPVTTSSEIQVLGAGVRTAGNAGIRFVGSVGSYDTTDVKAYGIAIAFGEVDVNDILLGETIGGKSVLTATDTELDGEGYFYIVLYGVPEASYAQDVTARAYVILNDDSVVYSTTATTRNLAEVAIKAKDEGESGGLIDIVTSAVKCLELNSNDLAKITASSATKLLSSALSALSASNGDKCVVKFDSNIDHNRVYTVGSDLFADLSTANSALVNDDVLYIANGTYALASAITKQVTFAGPNYGVEGKNHSGENYATIDFEAVAINSNYFKADGVKIQDVSASYASNNTQFVVAANTKEVIFKNVYFYSLANIMRYTNAGVASTVANGSYTVENCKMENLSQFVIFANATYADTLKEVRVINNKFTGTYNGNMGGYGMIRISGGGIQNTYVLYNNFDKDCRSDSNQFFRCQHGNFYVMFNKFNNVTKFNNSNSSLSITYNCNLYLNGSGEPLASAPDQVALNHGVKDKYVATSDEERTTLYNAYKANVVSTISFSTDGSAVGDLDYIEGLPVSLPTATKAGYVFLGWTLTAIDDDYITIDNTLDFTGNKTLYAHFEEALDKDLDVTNAVATKLNSYVPDIIVKSGLTAGNYTLKNATLDDSYESKVYVFGTNAFATIDDALDSLSVSGKKIFVFGGTYSDALLVNYGVTIDSLGDVTISGDFNIANAVSGLTLKNLEFQGRIVFNGNISNLLMDSCEFNIASGTDGSIYITGTANNFTVNNCEGVFHGTRSFKFIGIAQNITFTNNRFNGSYTLEDGVYASGVCDSIRFEGGIKTSLILRGNTIHGVGQCAVYALNTYGGTFVIEDNEFTDYHRSALEFRGQQEDTVRTINVVHNVFSDADNSWACLRIYTSGLTGTIAVTFNYNVMENLGSYSYAVRRYNGTVTAFANCDYNYSDSSIGTFDAGVSSHTGWFASKEALESAYSAYLAE
ncbi:MAG: InlB B-repeat-containing protein [Bacilli bacterium]|nr:InlB B-repeat-containing protein [Bacilli bacterium]